MKVNIDEVYIVEKSIENWDGIKQYDVLAICSRLDITNLIIEEDKVIELARIEDRKLCTCAEWDPNIHITYDVKKVLLDVGLV